MASKKELQAIITIAGSLDPSLGKAIKDATKQSKDLDEGIGGALKNIGKGALNVAGQIAKVGAAVGAAAAAGAAALGKAAAETGKEFESSMSQVAATMLLDKSTEEGRAAYETLEKAARDMGKATAFSASEAAEALNYLALAGYDANKAAGALPTVLRIAGAGAMELADASDLITDAMSALNIEATQENLEGFADNLAMAASKSNTSVPQLGEAMLTVGGTAANLKGGITELSTALGILADNGIKASEGGTHLRNMILSLQNPRNSSAATLMHDLGISAYDAEGNMRSLGHVFMDLNNAMSNMSEKQRNSTLATIFKQTDLAAARAMLGATTDDIGQIASMTIQSFGEAGKHLDDFKLDIWELYDSFDAATTQEQFAAKMMQEYGMGAEQAGILFGGLQSMVSDTGNRFQELSGYIAESAGAAEDMYRIQKDNLVGDVDKLKSAFDDLKISIYEAEKGPLRDLVQYATQGLGAITEWFNSDKVQTGISNAMTTIGNGMAFVMDTVMEYGPVVMGHIEQIVGKVMEVGQNVFNAVNTYIVPPLNQIIQLPIWTYVGQALGAILKFLTGPFLTGVINAIGNILGKIGELMASIGSFVEDVMAMPAALGKVWDDITSRLKPFADAFKQTWEDITKPIRDLWNLMGKVRDGLMSLGSGKNLSPTSYKLPAKADGGFTRGLTIAGEAGTEAVISFKQSVRSQNLGYWAKAGQMLGVSGQAVDMLSNNNRGGNINFSPTINISGNASRSDVLDALREAESEFLDILEEYGLSPDRHRGLSYGIV